MRSVSCHIARAACGAPACPRSGQHSQGAPSSDRQPRPREQRCRLQSKLREFGCFEFTRLKDTQAHSLSFLNNEQVIDVSKDWRCLKKVSDPGSRFSETCP